MVMGTLIIIYIYILSSRFILYIYIYIYIYINRADNEVTDCTFMIMTEHFLFCTNIIATWITHPPGGAAVSKILHLFTHHSLIDISLI
jgi:hypothetical protein